MIPTKVFSVEEANRTLPLVRRIVSDILRAGQDIHTISMAIENPEEDPRVIALMDELDHLFEEMEALGCSYRDWNFQMGLVDFPSVIQGREVSLCWRSDEEEVLYYHDLESGYAGRKPIPKKDQS